MIKINTYKKLKKIVKLTEIREKSLKILFIILVLNVLLYCFTHDTIYAIGSLCNLFALIYLIFDYKTY